MILIKQTLPEASIESETLELDSRVQDFALTSPSAEFDLIGQLRTNLAQLEDLHGRLRFVMSDVKTILKKKI